MISKECFETGEVIKARVVDHDYIFHYGIIIYHDLGDGVCCCVAHNPSKSADGHPKPTIEHIDDFFKKRKLEESFGVITDKDDRELMEQFNRLKHIDYNYAFFNCEDFINKMIGSFRFQGGKIQLGIVFIVVSILVFSLIKKGKSIY